jgi:hypothetical protein
MKNFKNWLRSTETIEGIIRRQFADVEKVDLTKVVVYVARLPTGQQVNFSIYQKTPNKVQIGFTVDMPMRQSYGTPSPKDPASNERLMPGSLALMRILKTVAADLQSNGIEITYNPIDQRRDQLYRKYLG